MRQLKSLRRFFVEALFVLMLLALVFPAPIAVSAKRGGATKGDSSSPAGLPRWGARFNGAGFAKLSTIAAPSAAPSAAPIAAMARPPAPQTTLITGTTTQLTTNPATQTDPSISGTLVVWTDQRNGNDDIYYRDINGSEIQLTSATSAQRLHDVSGNTIVYTDLTSPGPNIHAFDVTTNTDSVITAATSPSSGLNGASNARIDGSLVAYEVSLPGATDIGFTHLDTGASFLVAGTSAVDQSPSVSGSRIVFERHEVAGQPGDIILYNVTTGLETPIASGPTEQQRPDIDGNFVVYEGESGGDRDVFIYNLTTGITKQLSLPGTQRLAHVSGDFVSFDDDSAGNHDVSLYHIPTGTIQAIATGAGSDFLNDIGGNHVVYVSNQSGNFDIWMFTLDLPDIAVAPLTHDFGDVTLGSLATTVVTVSNVGLRPLTVSALSFQTGSSPAFTITSSPTLPLIIAPGATFDLPLAFTPTSPGFVTATLSIMSDDPDEGLMNVALSGAGVQAPTPPQQQIAEILVFFDESVANGTLLGNGPGNSAQGRRNALRNMLRATSDLIENGSVNAACQQLLDAYRRTDGLPQPPDFVGGTAATELARRIRELRQSLGCF
jgi:beta propeller repeat protein